MNQVKLEGTLSRISEETTKNDKRIVKLVLAVERPQWQKERSLEPIEVAAFGRTGEEALSRLRGKEGAKLSVIGRVTGREYGGRFFVSIGLEAFEVVADAPPLDNMDGPDPFASDDVSF